MYPQAIVTAGLQPTLDDVNFVGTVFQPAYLDDLPVAVPSANLTKVPPVTMMDECGADLRTCYGTECKMCAVVTSYGQQSQMRSQPGPEVQPSVGPHWLIWTRMQPELPTPVARSQGMQV